MTDLLVNHYFFIIPTKVVFVSFAFDLNLIFKPIGKHVHLKMCRLSSQYVKMLL
jgi:hypothetical protein